MRYITITFILFYIGAFAQNNDNKISILSVNNNDTIYFELNKKITIVSLFSVYCKPCIRELNAINSNYKKWMSEFDLKIYAITSAMDKKKIKRTEKFAAKKDYKFTLYNDYKSEVIEWIYKNDDLIKENGFRIVNNRIRYSIPQCFIFDSKGKIIYQKHGFITGDDKKMYQFLKNL